MNTKYFNFFIIALLIVILLVTSGQVGCKEEEELEFNTTALIMNFVEEAPPYELVPEQQYPIYVDISNKGGADISQGAANFYLSGIGENLQDVNTKLHNSNFLAKKTKIQEGGEERLIFTTDAKPISLPATFDFIIRLDSCYKYNTLTQATICVGKKDSVVCSISGEKIKKQSNSAAPIQITSISEEISGNKLIVRAVIENKGLGKVYLPNADCDKIQQEDIDEKLKQNNVEIEIRAGEGFSCRLQDINYGAIDSLSGITSIGTVTCQKTLTDAETHSSAFEIVLSYIYGETITKNLKILPV